MTEAIAVQVLASDAYAIEDVPVPITGPGGSCRVRLKSVTGARATQVPVIQDGAVAFRVEVSCEDDETILLDLTCDPQRGLLATAVGKNVLVLPGDDKYAPPPPWRPLVGTALDLCVLVDATTLTVMDSPVGKQFGLLLDVPAEWRSYVDTLLNFAESLAQTYTDLRTSVLAFGDLEVEDVEAFDLRPEYVLAPAHPAARRLRAQTREQFKHEFLELAPTPGGDFVDALADALVASGDIGWRPMSRKLLVLVGDSPGFSIQHAAPQHADSHVREHDVDEAGSHLRGRGVEIITIFHAHRDVTVYSHRNPWPFVHFARDQYFRLASCASYAFDRSSFDPERAARLVRDSQLVFGGDTALGQLQEIVTL